MRGARRGAASDQREDPSFPVDVFSSLRLRDLRLLQIADALRLRDAGERPRLAGEVQRQPRPSAGGERENSTVRTSAIQRGPPPPPGGAEEEGGRERPYLRGRCAPRESMSKTSRFSSPADSGACAAIAEGPKSELPTTGGGG